MAKDNLPLLRKKIANQKQLVARSSGKMRELFKSELQWLEAQLRHIESKKHN
tara:strand:- start:30 stop:185 length:156 start_codon:yes stop_codon:yes gene_type:complete